MTRDEAIAACVATGWRRPECLTYVDDRMVNGVYCDGSIVVDASGSRCVPRDVVDRVQNARDASPLPSSSTTSSASGPSMAPAWIALGLAAVVVVLAVVASGKG